MTEFKREARYVVVKISDLADTELTKEQISAFNFVCDQVAITRVRKFKKPLECVVVESDWPEYEPTWAAIESRMTGRTVCKCGKVMPDINASVEAKLDAGYPCPHSTRPPNPPTPPGWRPRGPWEPPEPGRQCG